LYQGNTSAAAGTIFKRDWFRHYTEAPEKFTRIVQSWDTAFKTGAANDYSVCATVGETLNGFYLLALYRAKIEFPELRRQIGLQADMWHPHEVLIEDRASGQSLIQELKLATNYPVVGVRADKDKETRGSATTGFYESGRVLFPADAPWLVDLEDELASFPGGLHDDQVDALSQALNRLRGAGDDLSWINTLKKIASGALNPFPKPQPIQSPAVAVSQPGMCSSDATCGNPLHITVAGGSTKCNSCGAQFWPDGANPRPVTRFSRKDLPRAS